MSVGIDGYTRAMRVTARNPPPSPLPNRLVGPVGWRTDGTKRTENIGGELKFCDQDPSSRLFLYFKSREKKVDVLSQVCVCYNCVYVARNYGVVLFALSNIHQHGE